MSNSGLVSYTRLSPNCNSPRDNKILKITPHHMAGNLSLETFGEIVANPSRQMSSNYAIDSNGNIGLFCNESDRSWCSSSPSNDHQAITIEVANDGGAPDWHVSDKALNALIDLCVDICQRNGIESLNFTGDESGNLTMHKYFTATACPGPYLSAQFQTIAETVNNRLGGTQPMSFIQQIATLVQKYAPQYDIAVNSPAISQGVIESANGTSELAVNANNFHGLKWRDGRCPTASGIYSKQTKEWVNGEYITITSDFCKFPSMDAGVQGYFDFINISNYANLKGVTDPLTYTENIKADGYATSPTYVETIMNTIEKYDLTQYDNVEPVPSEPFVPHKLKIGFASGGDINSITRLLSELAIAFTVENGYVYTDVAPSQGDYNSIKALCDSLGIPCVSVETEAETEPGPTPSTEVEELQAELAEVKALAEKYLYRAVEAEKLLEAIKTSILNYEEATT